MCFKIQTILAQQRLQLGMAIRWAGSVNRHEANGAHFLSLYESDCIVTEKLQLKFTVRDEQLAAAFVL